MPRSSWRCWSAHTRHEPDVLTLYNPGSVAEQIRADGVRVRDLGMTSNTQLGALLRLRSIIAEGRYDVVHTHLYRSSDLRPPGGPAGPHAGGRDHRALDRRDAHRAAEDDHRSTRTLPRVGTVLRRHDRRFRRGEGAARPLGCLGQEDHRDPQWPGNRGACLRSGGTGAGPEAVRPRAGHVRDRRAGADRREQARRADDRGGRAAPGRAVQDPGDRTRRPPSPRWRPRPPGSG